MKDLTCGMNVAESSKFKTVYEGKTYYFCSSACKIEFDKNPKKYVKK